MDKWTMGTSFHVQVHTPYHIRFDILIHILAFWEE